MTKQLSYKMICYFLEDSGFNEGFTLIELLVVVIILGVLGAIALPNFVNQAGKARETELKNAVGILNRAQQAYHFEHQTFATTISSLSISLSNQYITNLNSNDFITLDNGDTAANVQPANSNAASEGTRSYSGRIAFNQGEYQQILCQSENVMSQLPAPLGTAGAVICPPNISAEVR